MGSAWFPYVRQFVSFILSCFSDVWEVMCSPFINDVSHGTGGSSIYPRFSYLIPLIAIACTFIAVALVKKLILVFIERSS